MERNGRFTGYYRLGTKRVSVGTFDTKLEAEFHALEAEKGGYKRPTKTNSTLANFSERWLDTSDLLPITKKGYISLLNRFILPALGDLEMGKISKAEVTDLIDDLRKQGVKPATLVQVKACLGSMFTNFSSRSKVSHHPTQGVKIKITKSHIEHTPEPEEFKAIVEALPNEVSKLFARFLVASGCRFGEATELRVKDFNFKTNEVRIERRVSDLGKNYNKGKRFVVIAGTKSGRKRSIRISKAIAKEIESLVKGKAIAKDDLVFSRARVAPKGKLIASRSTEPSQPFEKGGKKFQHGTLYSYTHGGCRCEGCRQAVRERQRAKAIAKAQAKGTGKAKQKVSRSKADHKVSLTRSKAEAESYIDNMSHLPRDIWRKIWITAIDKSAIGWFPRTHDLRHVNATQLLKNGVDIHEVKERLGHQSIKTTERYLHRLRSHRSEASEGANDYLE